MEFQFLCPQGHLLQGDETLVGQQCRCPYCQTLFLVPPPVVSSDQGADFGAGQFATGYQSGYEAPAAHLPVATPPASMEVIPADEPEPELAAEGHDAAADFAGFEGPEAADDVGEEVEEGVSLDSDEPASEATAAAAERPTVHIICPSGHRLETPRDMLGQEALCPFCSKQFRLRFQDTVEYRQQVLEERARREEKTGQLWLYWSVGVGVAVIVLVVILVVVAAQH